jgi:hypothetical protein
LSSAEIRFGLNGLTYVSSAFTVDEKKAMLEAVVAAYLQHGSKKRACQEVFESWSKERRKVASLDRLNTWTTWYKPYIEAKAEWDKKKKSRSKRREHPG